MDRKAFYQSKVWRKTSKAYAKSKFCLCERCGRPVYVDGITRYLPKEQRLRSIVHHKEHLNNINFLDDSIALNFDNLELLCIECHSKEHNPIISIRKGLMFDEMGNVVEELTPLS